MKKTTIVAGLIALAIASNASAQSVTNIIRITGATAYRAASAQAMTNLISSASLKYGYTGTKGLAGANVSQVQGILKSDSDVFVSYRCSFSGSIDGIQRLVYRGQEAYKRTDWPNQSDANLPNAQWSGDTYTPETADADVAMSDSYQTSTVYRSPALTDNIVGVVPFVWVRNAGSPASLSNMTSLAAQKLTANGDVPLSFFTGTNADANVSVFIAGRNINSGTRLCTLAETGYGIYKMPNHRIIYHDSANVTNMTVYPGETVLGTEYGDGESGYDSGSHLATAFTKANSTNATVNLGDSVGWIVASMSYSDSKSVSSTYANNLLYNGVAFSANAVRDGQYTFWSYEHLFYRTDLDATLKTRANALRDEMLTMDPGSSAVKLDTMNVKRSTEGGVVTPGKL